MFRGFRRPPVVAVLPSPESPPAPVAVLPSPAVAPEWVAPDTVFPSGTCRLGEHDWEVIYTDDDQCRRRSCRAVRLWPSSEVLPDPVRCPEAYQGLRSSTR